MDIHIAGVTLHALVNEAVEERATVIAEGGAPIGVDLELVLSSGIICIGPLICPRAGERDKFMASLVDHKTANLALESLFSKPPDEVRAVAAESRLLEEPGYEFMVLDLVDVLLPQGAFPSKPICDVRGGRLVQTYISHVPLKTKRYNATALRCCLGVVFSPFRRAALNVAAEECGAAVFTGDTVLTVSEEIGRAHV